MFLFAATFLTSAEAAGALAAVPAFTGTSTSTGTGTSTGGKRL